jgi:PDZ domain-containing protein
MLAVVPTGFLLEGPGPSFDLQADISVKGAETYSSQGELLLTSVSFEESRLIYHILSLFDEGWEMVAVRDYLGEELDTEEQETVDTVITFISQDTATVVGLEQAGMQVEVDELGAFVVDVGEDYPAYGIVNPGEVIVAVNGVPVENAERLSDLVNSGPEGDPVTLQVKEIDEDALDRAEEMMGEEGSTYTPDLSTLLEDDAREAVVEPVYDPELDRAIIGVSVRDYFSYSSSVDVAWDLETVKGPSAGLMMTIALINTLTPEDLTGAEKIAGTGEISLDGDVGPIGGLPFKIQAAESEGAEIFIYPVENGEDLEGFSTSLQLFPVDTLQDALEVLESLL